MKKFLFLISLFVFTFQVQAANIKEVYVVKNSNPEQIINKLTDKLNTTVTIDKINSAIYSLNDDYYIKLYPNDKNTEVFLYCANQSMDLSAMVKSLDFKVFSIDDKTLIKKYNSDFVKYSQNNNLAFVKAAKKGTADNQGSYNPYSKDIDNKIIETLRISNNDIEIKRIQYVPKYKVKKKANEYEYLIANNTNSDIVINKVASDAFIGLTQIASYCVIPQWQDFIPFYGIIYGTQTDIEKNKFTRPHPIDEVIKKGETMRILALSKKEDNPIADFYFTVNNKEIIFVFDSAKGEKI